jgi:hypothetical protein
MQSSSLALQPLVGLGHLSTRNVTQNVKPCEVSLQLKHLQQDSIHGLSILTAERICNYRNAGLWNNSIMCFKCGVTEQQHDNAWRLPTVLHCTPTWQGRSLNMNDQPHDRFTDVTNLCPAPVNTVYILSQHYRKLTVIIQHHILSPTGDQN